MKRIIISCIAMITLLAFASGVDIAQYYFFSREESRQNNGCVGYSIIDANKGIDCSGDTVRLKKRNGFYELSQDKDHSGS